MTRTSGATTLRHALFSSFGFEVDRISLAQHALSRPSVQIRAPLGGVHGRLDFPVGLFEEGSYNGMMMRLAPVLVLLLVACGGGQSEAERPKAEKLSAGEMCIRDANVKQTPPLDAPQRIDVAHILIKHDQVKGAVKENITRTREDACLRALKAREFVLSSNDWEAAYKKYSDAGGATEGVLSGIAQGDVETSFSNAAFSLKVDEISHVVESPRGFHIILRKH